MTTTQKSFIITAALFVVALGIGYWVGHKPPQAFGAISGMLAENYDPYLRNNGGYNTALPIQTSSTITGTGASSLFTWGGVILNTGTALLNNVEFAINGYSASYTTSTVLTTAQFCNGTDEDIPISAATGIILTFPAATSTYAACPGVVGAGSTQYIINESSFPVTIATTTGENLAGAGHGVKFLVASSTVGTNATPVAPNFPIMIPASSTLQITGIYTSTSTLWMQGTFYKML